MNSQYRPACRRRFSSFPVRNATLPSSLGVLGSRSFSGAYLSSRGCLIAISCLALVAPACDDRTRTRKVLEPFILVPGRPQVDTGTAQVLSDATRENDHFAVNVPHPCDVFQQLSVRKVDILWVVDSSGSMAPKQARLAANFQGFISQLVAAQPPIDFHIAVTSTDTDDPATRGKLNPWSLAGRSAPYIACTPDAQGGSSCNTNRAADAGTADAMLAFNQMATVGTSGSPQERGLLATYLALTDPANLSTAAEERFVRADAALYVVVVSDEDDSSCDPLVKAPVCTADPGCRCASDAVLSGAGRYGPTGYFSRFLETYKGYGNKDLVALAAIVALDGADDAGVPSQFGGTDLHVGCCRSLNGQPCPTTGANDGGFEVAYFGGRYAQVAADTGGVAVSICDANFSGALASLGYAASGLRKEFRLSRGPVLNPVGTTAKGVELFVSGPNSAPCTVSGNCPPAEVCRSGRCARAVDVGLVPSANAPHYVKCDASALRNLVRFEGTSVPESLSTVEICYDVEPAFQSSCP